MLWQGQHRFHFVSNVKYISGAKFEDSRCNISRDIRLGEFYFVREAFIYQAKYHIKLVSSMIAIHKMCWTLTTGVSCNVRY